MIDTASGTITLDGVALVKPSFTRTAFESSALAATAKPFDGADGWRSYEIGSHTIFEQPCNLTLRFHREALVLIPLWLEFPEQRPETYWTVEAADAARSRHDAWLARHLGPPPYSYPWGTIRSTYDPQSVSSVIGIRYTANT